MGIWNKVQRGVGRAASEAEKQAAIAKFSLEITSTTGKVRQRTMRIGEEVLKLVRSGDLKHASLQAMVADVDRLEAKVVDLENSLSLTKSSRQ